MRPAQFESVIIQTPKPYGKLVSGIQALGGNVKRQCKYVDGVAADIPTSAMDSLRDIAGRFGGEIVGDLTIFISPPISCIRLRMFANP